MSDTPITDAWNEFEYQATKVAAHHQYMTCLDKTDIREVAVCLSALGHRARVLETLRQECDRCEWYGEAVFLAYSGLLSVVGTMILSVTMSAGKPLPADLAEPFVARDSNDTGLPGRGGLPPGGSDAVPDVLHQVPAQAHPEPSPWQVQAGGSATQAACVGEGATWARV